MDVMIYLPDNSGYQLHIQDGKTAITTKFFDAMQQLMKLPSDLAQKCFALWLKSPLLDVQLKPHHKPFQMVKQWGLLIERFSKADDLVKMKDEPALVFKRNAFLTKTEEMKITDPSVLNILLMEAQSNIQNGIYPCDLEDVEQLGVLYCVMNKQQLEEGSAKNQQENFKQAIQAVVPEHMSKSRPKKAFLFRQKSIEDHVYNAYRDVASKEVVDDAQLEFMKICWQLPYYGSVVFDGEVENNQNGNLASWFLQNSVVQVLVAINTLGIWIINAEKKHVLLGLKYGEFNWDVATADEDDENPIPSLFIEFDVEKSTKLLQVISKQASMMNSMIETCTAMALQAQHLNRTSPEKETNNVEDANSSHQHSRTASRRVRPLLDRHNTVTCGRPEKLNLTCMSDKESEESAKPFAFSERSKPESRRHSARNFFRKSTKHKTNLAEEDELL